MKIKKELLDNAPVADPFSDIPDERKAELKRMAQEEWETHSNGSGGCSYTVSMIDISSSEAHTLAVRAARLWHKVKVKWHSWLGIELNYLG